MDSVTINVPATTSNLGPGFDTLGIALNLHNHIVVAKSKTPGVDIVSPISEESRIGATEMLREAAQAFFRVARVKPHGVEVSLTGDVPIARGLGSSVTARLGVVAALGELNGCGVDRQRLLDLVTSLEHHPDNAAPAIFGGFTAAGMVGNDVRCLHCRVSSKLAFVTLVPDFEVSTEKARRLVPNSFTKLDTVHNLNRSALITAAFMSRKYEDLRDLFEDRVHQPYREPLIPQLSNVIHAGEKAGAIGGWLSGSGSTIICLALKSSRKVADAMAKMMPGSSVKILRAENRGFTVLRRASA